MKQRLIDARKSFPPESQGPLRRARVYLIGAIAHPNDARLVAGTRTAVAGAVSVDQDYSFSRPSQLIRCPGAKDSGADNRHVVDRLTHRSKCLLIQVEKV